jgi:hypothetical protein
MSPCDAPDSYGWTPAVGETDINAPPEAIVKWQALYSATNNGGRAARLRRICGTLPTIVLWHASTSGNGKHARLRGSTGGRKFAPVRHSRRNIGEVRWPGKHRRSLKSRLGWKSTCTPARRASKPPCNNLPGSSASRCDVVLFLCVTLSSQTPQKPRHNPDAIATAGAGFRQCRPPPTGYAARPVFAVRHCPDTKYRNLPPSPVRP